MSLQVSHIAIIAVGMTLVIVTRGIDLSVGAGVALTGVVAAMLQIDGNAPAWVAIAAALAAGGLIGAWQGFWVCRFNIPAFVVTLAGFNAFRGLALVASDARGLAPMKEDFGILVARVPFGIAAGLTVVAVAAYLVSLARRAGERHKLDLPAESRLQTGLRIFGALLVGAFVLTISSHRGLPVPVLIAIAVGAVGVFIAEKTVFGRHVYALGGNPEAARLSGIDVKRTLFFVYVFIGVLTAIGGVVLTARIDGVTPGNAGNLLELDVITAVVIGGTSLSGGRGSIVGSLLGAMLFGTLSNGMNLLGVSSNWQLILKGLILMAAVLFDVLSKKNK